MAGLADHSNCCGIKHIEEFESDEDAHDILDHTGSYPLSSNLPGALARAAATPGERKLLEVVLNRDQVVEYAEVVRTLKTEGFRLVSEFNNSSGSDCFVFHRHNCGIRSDRPANLNEFFPLGEQAAAPVVAPPPPQRVVLFSTFHCVFADGRKGAGYDTVAEARDNLGRRRRITRRDILSDGTTVWVEVE